MFAQNALIDAPLLLAALSAPLAYRDWQLQPTVQPINTNKGISVARSRLAALLQRPLYDLDRVSAPCWRSRPFSTSISAGRRSAEQFTFTSALPVQVLKGMAPLLLPYLQPGSHSQCMSPG